MKPDKDIHRIEITAAELAAIARAKRPARPRNIPPKELADYPLPPESRLWFVAEFIHQARLAKRAANPDQETSWRERAQDIAAGVASIYVHAPPDEKGKEVAPVLLRQVADALEGKHPPEARETDQQKVLTAIADSYRTSGRAPSNKELRGLGISGRAIDEVLSQIRETGPRIRLHKERHGKKPSAE